ncbi:MULTISPECIES: agmatinase [unclassified Aureimonas]|uniref:agmatinase n=1 Tax=unclassified Aureimonas TaxID=2615206 RepID=UPI0006F64C34|nr:MULTISPECIES: agmatinase [unclassified Aureimonas]KQT52992.1 agmatinase [Aureimonas sp. Leaf427]KQT80449.1 agmatinase [Aureimonas sp. Leaf460]
MAGTTIDNAFTATTILGAAGDPTYAGIPSFMRRRLTKDAVGADVTVWGIPFDASVSNRPGTRFGPSALRRASQIFDNDPQYPFHRDLFEALSVVDYGDCRLDYRLPETAHATILTEAQKLLGQSGFLLTLGGDHSITFPLLQAHAEKHGKLSLVHFDAHQDTWPLAGERVDHGSFLTAALKHGLIDPESSIQIGIRTHAPETGGLEIIHGNEVEDLTSAEIAKRIYERTGGTNVYLTFDIDCLDVAFAPGTGTPVAGGPSSAKMLAVLHHLKNLQIVGADVVEVSPPYDHADMTAIAGATVALYVIGILAEKKAG